MSTNIELNAVEPVFEGFTIQMLKPGQRRRARAVVTSVLGAGWTLEAFGDAGTDFEVTKERAAGGRANRKGALTAGRAWEKTYLLRAEPGVVHAEPIFSVPVSGPPEFRAEAVETKKRGATAAVKGGPPRKSAAARGLFGSKPLAESDDPAWSIKEVKVVEAWERFFKKNQPGAGVVVGHPDTGYSEHPEIVSRLLPKKGFDFVKDDDDAKDDLDSGLALFPGHGTGTSSVIVSPRDAQGEFGEINGEPIAVWGVAHGARLIPVRVSRSVVLDVPWAGGGTLNLAKAIELATDRGAHVISISMGTGFANARLLKAVQHAMKRGVIVCAAAGNYVGFVVWPAAYAEVVAVAASNARRKTWKHSSHGDAVDVTAPGESVWCAGVDEKKGFTVGRGSGTSFAVATVAGVAALWLSHHGRANLAARFGEEKIPVIFNQMLRDSCDAVPGWDSGFGRGLVNAEKLLAAPLPAARGGAIRGGAARGGPVPMVAHALVDHPAIDNGGLTTFTHLFENALPGGPAGRPRNFNGLARAHAELQTRLAELLRVTEAELPSRLKEVGQELAFHLASDPELYARFAASLSRKKPRGAARPTTRAGGAAAAGTEVGALRAALLSKDTSRALGEKLAGGL